MKILTAVYVSLLFVVIPVRDFLAQSFTSESGYAEFVSGTSLVEFNPYYSVEFDVNHLFQLC